jgi:hypothetical protein
VAYTGPGVLLARAVLQDVSGLPRDEVEMGFVFRDATVAGAGPVLVTTLVEQFYNTISTGMSAALSTYLSPTLSRSSSSTRIDVYDIGAHLDGSPHGTPILSTGLALAASGSPSELPNQVAEVLAYHAADADIPERGPSEAIPTEDEAQDVGAPATHPGTPRLKARARGRIYFGPLDVQAMGGTGEPATGFITNLSIAATALRTAGASGNTFWAVWSRRDAAVRDIVGGWLESEFGIQRRRRETPLTRNLWPV